MKMDDTLGITIHTTKPTFPMTPWSIFVFPTRTEHWSSPIIMWTTRSSGTTEKACQKIKTAVRPNKCALM